MVLKFLALHCNQAGQSYGSAMRVDTVTWLGWQGTQILNIHSSKIITKQY